MNCSPQWYTDVKTPFMIIIHFAVAWSILICYNSRVWCTFGVDFFALETASILFGEKLLNHASSWCCVVYDSPWRQHLGVTQLTSGGAATCLFVFKDKKKVVSQLITTHKQHEYVLYVHTYYTYLWFLYFSSTAHNLLQVVLLISLLFLHYTENIGLFYSSAFIWRLVTCYCVDSHFNKAH